MRLDHLEHHLNRRQLLAGAAKLGAGAAVAMGTGGLLTTAAGASPTRSDDSGDKGGKGGQEAKILGTYDDSWSPDGAKDGSWARESAARYGKDMFLAIEALGQVESRKATPQIGRAHV